MVKPDNAALRRNEFEQVQVIADAEYVLRLNLFRSYPAFRSDAISADQVKHVSSVEGD